MAPSSNLISVHKITVFFLSKVEKMDIVHFAVVRMGGHGAWRRYERQKVLRDLRQADGGERRHRDVSRLAAKRTEDLRSPGNRPRRPGKSAPTGA